jgi:hypothetical protein
MEQTEKNGEAMSANNGSAAHYAREQERLSYNDFLEASDNAVRGLRNRIPPHIFDRHALSSLPVFANKSGKLGFIFHLRYLKQVLPFPPHFCYSFNINT